MYDSMISAQAPTRRLIALAALVLAAILLLSACGAGEKGASGDGVRVLLDGKAWDGQPLSPEAGEALRVYITHDGKPLIDLPFGVPRTVAVLQDAGENTVEITADAVFMAHADCENQDCVQMGAVTRENLELRVMGGFIVCLPHRISVEVRGE